MSKSQQINEMASRPHKMNLMCAARSVVEVAGTSPRTGQSGKRSKEQL